MISLDCRGKRCPLPVIALARAVPEVPVGEVVRVVADDPAAAVDIPARLEEMPAGRWAGFMLVWVALVVFTYEANSHRRRQLRLTALASAA